MSCIMPESFKKMNDDLKKEGSSLKKLRKLSGEERINFFAEYVDIPGSKTTPNAVALNKRYEENLLSPRRQEKLQEWLAKVKKEGIDTRKQRLLEERIKDNKALFDPKNENKFYTELVKAKLGFEVDLETSKAIFSAVNTLNQLKTQRDRVVRGFLTMTNKEYVELQDKADAGDVRAQEQIDAILKVGYARADFETVLEDAAQAGLDVSKTQKVLGTMKTLLTSLDVSFGRQMHKAMYASFGTNYKAWKKAMRVFSDSFSKSKNPMRDVKAMIYSHPYLESGKFEKLGLSFQKENTEFFPENYLTEEKQSKAGKAVRTAFLASENSFTAGVTLGKFNMGIEIIDRVGDDLALIDRTKMKNAINQLYGRGIYNIFNDSSKDVDGDIEKTVQFLALAPRFVMSQVHNILDLRYVVDPRTYNTKDPNRIANQMRAKAAVANALVMSVVAAGVNALSQTIGKDDDDERDYWDFFLEALNPQSANFGKIMIGKLALDISGGTASIVRLFAQGITGKGISSEGAVYDTNILRTLTNWISYKKSPAVNLGFNAVKSLRYYGLLGERFKTKELKNVVGEKVNVIELIGSGVLPITLTSGAAGILDAGIQAYKQDYGGALEILSYTVGQTLFDAFGVSARVYESSAELEVNAGKSEEVIKLESKISRNTFTDKGNSLRMFDSRPAKTSKIMTDLEGVEQEKAIEYRQNYYDTRASALAKSDAFKKMTYEQQAETLRKLGAKATTETNKKFGLNKKKAKKKVKTPTREY